MKAEEISRESRVKLRRARSHLEELIRLSSPLDPRFYEVVIEAASQKDVWPSPDGKGHVIRETQGMRLLYRPRESAQDAFAGIIGDALNNARSALDYLANGIARFADPKPSIHFPMARNRDDLVLQNGRRNVGERAFNLMETALPGTEHVILDVLRPLNGPDEEVWGFSAINNDDKHNSLTPLVTIAKVENVRARLESGPNIGAIMGRKDANQEMGILFSTQPFELEGVPETSVTVTMEHAGVMKGVEAKLALERVLDMVERTIDEFEKLVATRHSRGANPT